MLSFITKIKQDYSQFSRHSVWVVISIAIYSFGSGFFDPYFSVFLSSFVDGYEGLGLLVALFTLVSAVLTLPVGFLMDFVRYRTMLTIGKVLSIVVAFLYFFAGEYQLLPLLLVALVVNGIAFPFNWTGTETVLGAYSKKHKSTALFGFYGSIVNLTWIVGLLIATVFVIERYPLHFIFIPLMFFPILSILIFRSKLPENHNSKTLKEGFAMWLRDKKITGRFVSDIRSFNAEMWLMALLSFLEKFIQAAIVVFMPVFILKEDASLVQIGFLVGAMHIAPVFSFVFAELSKRGKRLLMMSMGFLVSCLSCLFLFMNLYSPYAIYACFFAITGIVMAAPNMAGIVVKLTPEGHFGTVTAFLTLIRRLGLVAAPVLIGYAADRYSPELSFLFVALVAGLMVVLIALARFVWIKKDQLYLMEHPNADHVPFYL